MISACSALMGGKRAAVVFAACRIASRSVAVRVSSSIARRGSVVVVVVVGVLICAVGMLLIPDRYAHTPVARKKQPQHLAIHADASYYMCMLTAVVPAQTPRSGSGTGVPIRHLRSSHLSGFPVVKALHHRRPLTGVKIFHPRGRMHGPANFAAPFPPRPTLNGPGNFPAPFTPPRPVARWCRFGTTVTGPPGGPRCRPGGGTIAGRRQRWEKFSRTVPPALSPQTPPSGHRGTTVTATG